MTAKQIFYFLFFIPIFSVAQNNTVASGGNASSAAGSSSYSVGQIVYTTNSSSGYSSAQGVQQPYEISVITETIENKEINSSYSVYPNPTNNYLIINTSASLFQNMHYELYSVDGKLLEQKSIVSNETTLLMEKLPKATYFIRLFDNSIEFKSFKIIKN